MRQGATAMSVHLGYTNVKDEPVGDGVLTIEILEKAVETLEAHGRPEPEYFPVSSAFMAQFIEEWNAGMQSEMTKERLRAMGVIKTEYLKGNVALRNEPKTPTLKGYYDGPPNRRQRRMRRRHD